MLCYVMLCCVISRYAVLGYVVLCYVVLCYVMLCYVMSCHVTSRHVTSCHVMSCHVMLCYVRLRYVTLCYVKTVVEDIPLNDINVSQSGLYECLRVTSGFICWEQFLINQITNFRILTCPADERFTLTLTVRQCYKDWNCVMHTGAPAAMCVVVYLLRRWILAFNNSINQTTKKIYKTKLNFVQFLQF